MSREYVLQPFREAVHLQIDYARELNEQQLAAVAAPPGPALVLAGAGSGKTRTLIYRVAYLLEQGIPPERILLLTFTNKAAREMMRRVGDVLGSDLSSLWGGTFHSIGSRILRRHANRLGYHADFTIMDREDSKDLIQSCIEEAKIDVKAARFPKAEVLAELFSFAVNTGRSVRKVIETEYEYFLEVAGGIEEVQKKFLARKQAGNVMDFDDLLVLWLRLFEEQRDIHEQYQRRFQFLLVDEYQDTNKIQSDLIDLIAARHGNVMAVGDDSQSIYSWRGANFANILEFTKRYPKAALYKIETNYRSTPEILNLANAAIQPNPHQHPKVLKAVRAPGQKPALVLCGDSREQAAFVAQRALELRDEGVNLNEMAVLYRSHFHALELQLELTRRNIPFNITSGIRFFEQAHIKDVAAYLKLTVNPHDELSFKRLVRLLPGVGGKGAEKLWSQFQEAIGPDVTLSVEESLAEVRSAESETTAERTAEVVPPVPLFTPRQIATALQQCAALVPKKTAASWAQFTATMAQLGSENVWNKPSEMIGLILEAGYDDYLKATFPNYRNRREDLEQLSAFALQFSSIQEFLTQLSLLSNLEADDQANREKESEQMRLSTVHQAKGLEFGVVFIIMLCEGMFPSNRSLNSASGLEEERRLFYVAITRAKDELYLSYPVIRAGYGAPALQQSSQFLAELPADLLDSWNLKSSDPW